MKSTSLNSTGAKKNMKRRLRRALIKSFFASLSRSIGVGVGVGLGTVLQKALGADISNFTVAAIVAIAFFLMMWYAEYLNRKQ
jgi:hypothetical protein